MNNVPKNATPFVITPVMLIMCGVGIVVLQFGFIFIMGALLPSVAKFYGDTTRGKQEFKTVFACNLAAMLPSLTPMVHSLLNLKMYDGLPLLLDSMSWLYAYMGAGAGLCLLFLCSFIGRFLVTLNYEYQVTALEAMQKNLVEEWGQQIKHPPAT